MSCWAQSCGVHASYFVMTRTRCRRNQVRAAEEDHLCKKKLQPGVSKQADCGCIPLQVSAGKALGMRGLHQTQDRAWLCLTAGSSYQELAHTCDTTVNIHSAM